MHIKTDNPTLLLIITLSIIAFCMAGCSPGNKQILNVSAGAGLTDAITEINQLYMEIHGDIEILNNFAAAGDLQTQIENGAPADVFISAGAKEMNALEEQGLIITETRHNIVGNQLVLIIHKDSSINISTFADLSGGEVELFAMGDPEFVPAGLYGLQTLQAAGLNYEALKPKIILGNNVRQVLNYVENKNVSAGIVYATDALASQAVVAVAIAPAKVNENILFPAAVIASSKNTAAAIVYNNFLTSPEAGRIFEKYGYILLND